MKEENWRKTCSRNDIVKIKALSALFHKSVSFLFIRRGPYGWSIFRFWRNIHSVFHSSCINPAVAPRRDIYPEKAIIQKQTCTPMFIPALGTIANTRKQPRCLSTDKWIKKIRNICRVECYSAIKRNELGSAELKWMKLKPVLQSEESQ